MLGGKHVETRTLKFVKLTQQVFVDLLEANHSKVYTPPDTVASADCTLRSSRGSLMYCAIPLIAGFPGTLALAMALASDSPMCGSYQHRQNRE